MANSESRKIDFVSSENHSRAYLEEDRGGPPILTWVNVRRVAGILFALWVLASLGSMALDMDYTRWLHGPYHFLPWLKAFIA